MNKKSTISIIKELGITPHKNLGQNFLINSSIIKKIISSSSISKNDIILEIGPGLGALTYELVKQAKQVYAVEIDDKLYHYLIKEFSNFGNIEIISGDILKIDIPEHNKVISNIPYKITGPILEKIFLKSNPPQGILSIEKAIADRIFFKGNYKSFSKITVSVNSFMKPVKRDTISRDSFYPAPKIDLSLISMLPRKNINEYLLNDKNRDFYLKFLGGIMPYKNKSIVNALQLFIRNSKTFKVDKQNLINILEQNNIENKKVFSLSIDEFIHLSRLIQNNLRKKKISEKD
ncbi:MAG: 16S rRNA (adenine(1518)-N(6)/adenine(1519)-N(6))-dimethyltransferase RsmA [Candidatus Hermodarchaeota archaeon]